MKRSIVCSFVLAALLLVAAGVQAATYDLVIARGRVIDPESGLDAIRDIGVSGGRIIAISKAPLQGTRTLDASGQVVAPGFIDLHSHAMTTPSMRMQAFDGVTTALELELGNLPIAKAYERAAQQRYPINYGFSASWALARMKAFDGVAPDGSTLTYAINFPKPNWKKLTARENIPGVIAELEQGLREGALGIGIMVGYAPATNREEFIALHKLAAKYGVPTFSHVRGNNFLEPGSSLEGFSEAVAAAAGTGAHAHLCHINSSSWRNIDDVVAFIAQAQKLGMKVTTEAYPYGAGSTTIGAPRYDPDNLKLAGIRPTDIYVVDTGQWVKDADELAKVRKERPSAIAIFHFLNESIDGDRKLLETAMMFPDTIIASDSLPYTVGGRPVEGDVWPLPDTADAHPRIAGTYARVLGRWVRERHLMTLNEAIRRSTLLPARLLEQSAPPMKNKGRLRVGADADIVVFDAAKVIDRATYENPRLTSVGFRHVIVGGIPLIESGELVRSATPGKPVRGPTR